MGLGPMLAGLLGAAGEDIATGEKRRYDEALRARQTRLGLLQAAASSPNLRPEALPAIFEE
ncbi:MAG TPA: hypothetical protein VIV12_31330, partial [Streptosporangiaceae bacterium]